MKELKTVSEVKQQIMEWKGCTLVMAINKGRNRIVTLQAIIDQVYPSMFVIKSKQKVDLDRFSYSYSDVLCGDIHFVSVV